jgi:DNA modification methylase
MDCIHEHLTNFDLGLTSLQAGNCLDMFLREKTQTQVEYLTIGNSIIPKYINEYWTAKQRQGNRLHEVSYRACFKPQLPNFFISLLTQENDMVFDPFSGRGTTAIESALLNRRFIANDINQLSEILAKPRTNPPVLIDISDRLNEIKFDKNIKCEIDLSMFYHDDTLSEILNLREYLNTKPNNDYIDDWIRMVATNRLTGHSPGFFSGYTLPPNQAVSPESQKKINAKRNETPPYRNVKDIIIKKSKSLLADIDSDTRKRLQNISKQSRFLCGDARNVSSIENESISLTVTSPPFLNIVQYAQDNWLRCWFNALDQNQIASNIAMAKTTEQWSGFISGVFSELYRITKSGGYVAFEVGEVNNGQVNLEEFVADIGTRIGFDCIGIVINSQIFTKTSNIWGVKNNDAGTNSNRIVLFKRV